MSDDREITPIRIHNAIRSAILFSAPVSLTLGVIQARIAYRIHGNLGIKSIRAYLALKPLLLISTLYYLARGPHGAELSFVPQWASSQTRTRKLELAGAAAGAACGFLSATSSGFVGTITGFWAMHVLIGLVERFRGNPGDTV